MSKNALGSKAVLAQLNITRWTGRRLDRKITDEINQQHGAENDAGRYNKLLIPKVAFERVNEATRAARTAFHVMTQPWMDDGRRLLPNMLFDKFAARFRELESNFNKASAEFCGKYPEYLKAAPKRLGKLYDPADYPDAKLLRRQFSFHKVILKVDDTDFRCDIPKETVADTERAIKEALDNAMKEPFRRIAEVVGRMAEKLKNYKPATEEEKASGLFRDSLVTNIRELIDLLPAFNLTGDATLAKLIVRMEKELCSKDAEFLRENDDLRQVVAKNAADILKQAEALMA